MSPLAARRRRVPRASKRCRFVSLRPHIGGCQRPRNKSMRKAGRQEGRNKTAAAGRSSRFLLSCLPAFLPSLTSSPGRQAHRDVRSRGMTKRSHAKTQRNGKGRPIAMSDIERSNKSEDRKMGGRKRKQNSPRRTGPAIRRKGTKGKGRENKEGA